MDFEYVISLRPSMYSTLSMPPAARAPSHSRRHAVTRRHTHHAKGLAKVPSVLRHTAFTVPRAYGPLPSGNNNEHLLRPRRVLRFDSHKPTFTVVAYL